MPASYVWTPSRAVVDRSNINRFMTRNGLSGYRELIDRSTERIEWFWEAVVEDLGISFSRPCDQILDASRGIAWPRWFVGGSINLAENCVDRHAQSGGRDRMAVIAETETGVVRRLSYADLHDETCRLSNGLRSLGIDVGDTVGLFLPMVPEAVIAFMACAKIGAVAVPIFSGFGAQAVAVRLADAGAKVIVTMDATTRRGRIIPMEPIAAEAARNCPTLKHMIVARRSRGGETETSRDSSARGSPPMATPFQGGERAGVIDWDQLLAAQSPECPSLGLDPETPVLIAYTSGTTGRPKGAVHVHGGFLAKIAQEAAYQVDMQHDDRLFWVTDLGWIMGPWEIVGSLAAGGTVVLAEGAPDYPGPDRLWSMIERHHVTILGISPTLIRALSKYGDEPIRSHDLSSLRILASTGEPWDPESWRWYFERAGRAKLPIINFSGGTEVGACLLSPLPITPLKPCSLGGPALGMAVDVFDADGRPVRGTLGELVCTKPWPAITRGIWGDSERYIATYWSRWPNVWVHGDWASIDADGDWFLHGRSDDTLNVAGKRLGPSEVESILAEHPAVAESAAVGVPDELKGEVILCFATLKPGHTAGSALRGELCDRVAIALGKSFAPKDVLFVAELPKTRSGKILRRVIRSIAINHDLGDCSSIENMAALDGIKQSCRGRSSGGASEGVGLQPGAR
jgi:acetyl-CoA synthetase